MKILISFLFTLFFAFTSFAQEREKPRLREFGYSLKQPIQSSDKNKPEENNPGEASIQVNTTLVVSDVSVTDKEGRAVEGLTKSDFVVTEDGQPQQIESLTLGNNSSVSRSIVLIFDFSNKLFIKESVTAAKTLVDKLNPNDRMAIVTQDIKLLQDFTRDKEALKKVLNSLEEKSKNVKGRELGAVPFAAGNNYFVYELDNGNTKPYSALLAALNEMFDAEDERPIIIFQTEGRDLAYLKNSTLYDHSPYPTELEKFSLQDVYQAVEKSRTTIYPVAPGFRFIGFTPDEELKQLRAYKKRYYLSLKPQPSEKKVDQLVGAMPDALIKAGTRTFFELQTALEGLSNISGGWMSFLEKPEQATDIYERILSDMNQRYIISYYPTGEANRNQQRRIKFEVRDHPEYTVIRRRLHANTRR